MSHRCRRTRVLPELGQPAKRSRGASSKATPPFRWGSSTYLYQWTRPNLRFAVTLLLRYLHRPGEKHLQAAKHTLRYLKGTVGLRIRYTKDLQRLLARDQHLNVLYALSDSDFAGCKDTSRSTSGYMILMNGGVVAYYSGRQSTIALCTAMAETIALTKLVVKVKHMRAVLFDLQCTIS
jgi:hypothetical protein